MVFAIRSPMHAFLKLTLATAVLVVISSTAAVLLVPPSPMEDLQRREVEARRLVDRLTQAVWDYHDDHGVFPPGTGDGSASLVAALRSPSPGGQSYMDFEAGALTELGDLRNPVSPSSSMIHYHNARRNAGQHVGTLSGARTGGLFYLWGRDARGRPDGVNNWE